MKLIPLTEIDGQFNLSHVLVNFDNVTHCFPQERTLTYRYNFETKTSEKLDLPEVRTLTVICFTAGLHEEPDWIWVTESLFEITLAAND